MNEVFACLLTMALVSGAAQATPVAPVAPTAPKCAYRINQPAASVRLNRPAAPADLCVKECQAKLVGTHREAGQIVALAIYTGKRCR
jgi:hypothetical protein